MRRATRAAGVVLAGLATVAATTVVTTSSTAATGSPAPAAVRASGGFGLASGSLGRVLPSAAPPAAPGTGQFGQGGGCSYYANNAGMGIYCGGATGTGPTLAELYGSQEAPLCKVFRIPDGMDRPYVERDDNFFWALQGCMDGIQWDTITGGPNIRVTMEWTRVPDDETVEQQNSALADLLWDMAQDNYPMPLVKIEPVAVPRVNTDAIFTFKWVDATQADLPVVSEGPHQGDPDGAPYQETNAGAATMRAEASRIRLVPLVEGMHPTECEVDPPPFDPDLGESAQDQNTKCFLRFPSSSAAAEELSTEKLPDGEQYFFLVRIEVTWTVTIDFAGGGQDDSLGSYVLESYQQVPVMQSVGTNYFFDN